MTRELNRLTEQGLDDLYSACSEAAYLLHSARDFGLAKLLRDVQVSAAGEMSRRWHASQREREVQLALVPPARDHGA